MEGNTVDTVASSEALMLLLSCTEVTLRKLVVYCRDLMWLGERKIWQYLC